MRPYTEIVRQNSANNANTGGEKSHGEIGIKIGINYKVHVRTCARLSVTALSVEGEQILSSALHIKDARFRWQMSSSVGPAAPPGEFKPGMSCWVQSAINCAVLFLSLKHPI